MVMTLIVAFPSEAKERQKLRSLVPDRKLPVVVPGSAPRPCQDCGLMLAVGPRSLNYLREHRGVVLCCPKCAVLRGVGAEQCVAVTNLGNPDSRLED